MATFDERFVLPTQLPELQDNRLINDFQVTPGTKIGNKLFGTGDEERYQTWPEAMARSGYSLGQNFIEGLGKVPFETLNLPVGNPNDLSIPEYSGATQVVKPNALGELIGMEKSWNIPSKESLIGRTQDLAGLITLGGIGGTPKGALGTSGSKLANHVEEMKTKYGDNNLWVSKQTDAEFAKYEQLKNEPIQLDNGKKLIPVKENPFAELEAGIAETVRGLPRERRTNPNITEEVPTQEIDKIHNIALDFVDKWNPKAREKRAEAQGFEQDAYHGTTSDFTNLAVRAPKGYGFYSTQNPKLSDLYAGKEVTYEPKVVPLKINTKEYNVVDAAGNNWDDINGQAIRKAIEENKKGVIIHNVYDHPSGEKDGPKSTVFISLDPTTVKSKFAKFNLEKLGVNDLLASGAGLLLGESVLDANKKKEPKLVPVSYNPFENAL